MSYIGMPREVGKFHQFWLHWWNGQHASLNDRLYCTCSLEIGGILLVNTGTVGSRFCAVLVS
jgi:hypothetical protein